MSGGQHTPGYVPGLSELLILGSTPSTPTDRVTIRSPRTGRFVNPTRPHNTTVPKRNLDGTVRDSQRSKLYAAEAELADTLSKYGQELAHAKGGTGGKWPSIPECQAYVDNLTRARWFQSRWGQVKIEVGKKTNGAATGTRHSRWSGTIQLPPWSRVEKIILHEVAHVLTPPGYAWHGPEFAAILLTLVRYRCGPAAATMLRASFGAKHVKYRTGMHIVPKAGSQVVLTGKRPSVKATAAVAKLTDEERATMARLLRKGLDTHSFTGPAVRPAMDLLHALEARKAGTA